MENQTQEFIEGVVSEALTIFELQKASVGADISLTNFFRLKLSQAIQEGRNQKEMEILQLFANAGIESPTIAVLMNALTQTRKP